MVSVLVDTAVIIDLLRGYQPAHKWFLQQNDLGVCRAVWLEILDGVQNRKAERDA